MAEPVMSTLSPSQEIEFDDIQGLVRFAHGRLTESAFVLLRVRDAEAARVWLSNMTVSTAAPSSPLPNLTAQVAFTVGGLRALGMDDDIVDQFSSEFTGGISADENRSRRLGDSGPSHPSHWLWGGTSDNTPHVLLMFYTHVGHLEATLQQSQQGGFDAAFAVVQTLKARAHGPEEPFGFVDGISQPLIDWQQKLSTDSHQRDHYSNLMAPGEVLLGYPNEYGLYTSRPLLNPGRVTGTEALPTAVDQPILKDLGRNGSYLVLRQLAQDVTGFWQFLDQQAGFDPQQRDQLAAAMVGRQRDGTPLVAASSSTDNHFTFDEDPMGRQCPIGAHIRRANPRSGDFPPGVHGAFGKLIRTLGFGRQRPDDDLVASSRFHRVLRRGRAYGTPLSPEQALNPKTNTKQADEDHGLYFVCLGANISRQFEFVQNAWSMSSKFAGLPTESDPLLGNREALASGAPTNSFTLPQTGTPARRIHDLPQFVTVRGGAYFFMPGVRALNFIVGKK